MSIMSLLQYALFLLVVVVLVRPLGGYLAAVFTGRRTWLDPLLRPVERATYRLTGVDPTHEMTWREYATAFVLFGLTGTLLLYTILRLQALLPGFNADALSTEMTPDLAMNTAISFATTTTWQAYAGETTMHYVGQMVGLAAQNFLAGAAGLAVGLAFIRGFAREEGATVGNFWVDVVRGIWWVLLPASLVGSLLLVWQGVPMNFHPYTAATGLEGAPQLIAQGPVAGLEWIKNLGTNGGGFFNVNGAHPYENPTPLTNLLEMLAIAVVPAALTNTFGRLVGRPRDGWLLFAVMTVLFTIGLLVCGAAEQAGSPATAAALTASTATQAGGNMEGKETRFGIGGSALTAVTTSNGATGSYNSMHDSYTALGGLVPLVNMLFGEILFGGLGTGLYSLILVALLGLFITGLMVGRTPEYVGKRLGPPEVKLIVLYTLLGPLVVLVPTAVAVVTDWGLAGLTTNSGPHGFTEILFAYASSAANNGQNFAGLSANTPFYNLSTAVAMMGGRLGLGITALALAGLLVRQPRRRVTLGTLPTDSVLFGTILTGTAVLVVGLTYLPALTLGPGIEALLSGVAR
ncbi:MAG TPA: potassium-transporting ATPase subunit KdpA [Chloroflexota bacterium]|nr:potassium-transporting ATPase subunit KdpA [Chloroflexota bacterium]